ncbi:MAG: hypothetical protein ABJE47_07505 [bacterium]
MSALSPISVLFLAAGVLAQLPAPVHAQTPTPRPPVVRATDELVGEFAMEQETRERWMHGRQLPRFSPFALKHAWIFVDSLRGTAAARQIYLTVGRSVHGRDSARIVVGATGHVTHLEVGQPPFVRQGPGYPGDSARWVALQRGPGDDGVSLIDTRLWDFVPAFPQSAPRVGMRWSDTLARVATSGPFRQSLQGRRTSRVTGDDLPSTTRWTVSS